MLESTFLHEMKEINSLDIEEYTIYKKPTTIYNNNTNESNEFKNLEDALKNGMIGKQSLKEFVKNAEIDIFCVTNDDRDIKFETLD